MDRKELIDEILTAWTDGRVQWTYSSQDICDEVRDIARLSVEEVTEWMMKWRYQLVLTDGRMTWVPPMSRVQGRRELQNPRTLALEEKP